MDSIANDPELGQDLLRLLHKKLQQKRQELDDLRKASPTEVVLVDSMTMRAENEELRSKLATLELQLSSALKLRDQDTKASSLEPSSSDSQKTVHEAMEDIRRREATQNETIAELQGKLDKYKETYNAYKSENTTLNETLMRVTEGLKIAIEGLDGLQKDISVAEMSLEPVKKPGSSGFDWEAFQNGGPSPSPKGTPQDTSLKPFLSSAAFSQLPKDMLKKYGQLKLLILRSQECEWSPNGVSRGLHLLPSFVYDPTAYAGNGGWIRNHQGDRLGRKKSQTKWEVLYQRKNEWYYYGTYQCVGFSSMISGELDVGGSVIKQQLEKVLALQTVVLHKEQVAPIVLDFMSALCNEGLMAFDLWGLERTAFNHSFNDSLRAHKKALQQVSSKKKSQGGQGDDGPPRKKQKVGKFQ